MTNTDTHVTAHGATIPRIGLGTADMRGEDGAAAVATALKLGYRHIDAARKYGTEEYVGEGLRAAGVPRSDIFLCTKVSHERLAPNDVQRSVDESLRALGVDYFDLLLIHWPSPDVPMGETLKKFAQLKREGITRHLGVANYSIPMVEQAVRECPEPLVSLQVEMHPYMDQSKVLAAARRLGLALTAYSPIRRGVILEDSTVKEIAAAHGKSPAQVALRWIMQHEGTVAIPKSSNPERLAQNLAVFDFELTDDEMRRLSALARPDGRRANPPYSPQWDA